MDRPGSSAARAGGSGCSSTRTRIGRRDSVVAFGPAPLDKGPEIPVVAKNAVAVVAPVDGVVNQAVRHWS